MNARWMGTANILSELTLQISLAAACIQSPSLFSSYPQEAILDRPVLHSCRRSGARSNMSSPCQSLPVPATCSLRVESKLWRLAEGIGILGHWQIPSSLSDAQFSGTCRGRQHAGWLWRSPASLRSKRWESLPNGPSCLPCYCFGPLQRPDAQSRPSHFRISHANN